MRRFAILLLALAFAGAAAAQTQIRWYVGLGAGSDVGVIPVQEEFVANFNASQDDIELILEIVDNDQAYDVLATQIAAGNPPDIVGPVGIRGRNAFPGIFADLTPYIEATDYDLSDFDPALVDVYNVEGEGQIGIPFAVFPSYITYNKTLFDEAGLPYPPHAYGEPYTTWEGETVDWDLAAMRDVGMLLTVDGNGFDAAMPEFDNNNVVQWGFGEQWTDLRGRLAKFGAGTFVDENGDAIIPAHWAQGVQWLHDAMWVDGWIPNAPYSGSDFLAAGDLLASGNVGMVHTHLWYQGCCMAGFEDEWDLAAMPTGLTGVPVAKLHGDTFGITSASPNKEAAFEVLVAMFEPENMVTLSEIYGGMPARESLAGSYIASFGENNFPDRDVDWSVVTASLGYADSPSHEGPLPAFRDAEQLYIAFDQRLNNEADLDVGSELALLQAELQLLFDSVR